MRFILAAILLLFLSITPTSANSDMPYVAIFCNPGWEEDFEKFKPDMIHTANDFAEFEEFLEQVKLKAGARKIIIDVATHGGEEDKLLHILYKRNGKLKDYESNMGFIINKIEKHLGNTSDNKVLFECCYSGLLMNGLNFTYRTNDFGDRIQCWNKEEIKIPLYGISDTSNYIPYIYLQDKCQVFKDFHDLRQYIKHPLTAANENEDKLTDIKRNLALLRIITVLNFK